MDRVVKLQTLQLHIVLDPVLVDAVVVKIQSHQLQKSISRMFARNTLIVFLLPGFNALVFFVANAYLFGREYFELAALRFRPLEEVRELRRRHAATLFLAGLFVAAFVAVPIVNLLTPLFGVAFMVRLHRQLAPPEVEALPNPAPPRVTAQR